MDCPCGGHPVDMRLLMALFAFARLSLHPAIATMSFCDTMSREPECILEYPFIHQLELMPLAPFFNPCRGQPFLDIFKGEIIRYYIFVKCLICHLRGHPSRILSENPMAVTYMKAPEVLQFGGGGIIASYGGEFHATWAILPLPQTVFQS